MKKLLLLSSLLSFALILSGCYKSFREEIPETWQALELKAEYPIRNVLATDKEILVATVGEFIRLDKDHQVTEQRQLDIGERVYGRPMISKDIFTRIIRPHQSENKQVVEFHLTKSKGDVKKFESDNIATDVNENLGIVFSAKYTGAFNATGTQYLLPTTSAQQAAHSFFLFDIKLNATKTKFVSVKVIKRINISEIPPDSDALTNVKFLNGNYYVTSQAGAFRIKPDGSYSIINSEWFLDSFEKDGNLFITGFENGNFFVSQNNGISWDRVQLETPTLLTLVDVVNGKVLTQRNEFSLFKLADEKLQGTLPIRYNGSFSRNFADSYNMVYFNEQYYLSVSKKIYVSKDLVLDL